MQNPVDNSILYKSKTSYDAAMRFYDEQLARITLPYQTQYLETDYGLTHILTAGPEDAPVVVLWHGMNANLVSWLLQINALAQKYRVIAPDAPGHSGKSDPRRLDRKTNAYGEWAAQLLAKLNIPQAHMVGISGGGWQILKLAQVAPQMISSATLISSAGFRPLRKSILFKMLPALLFSQPQLAARKFLTIMSPPDYQPNEDEVQSFTHMMNFKAERTITVLADNELARLAAPVQLLMGQYEVTYNPQAVIERARRWLPRLEKAEIVAGVGHGMISENPQLINAKIASFIEAQLKLPNFNQHL